MRAALGAILLLPLVAEAAELSIAVEGIHSSRGTVMIGLYDSAEGFKRAVDAADSQAILIAPSRYAALALRASAAVNNIVTLGNVDPGRYAVIVVQDVNNNAKLDRSFFGVPMEPYGFSNNATGYLEAPSFDDAAVLLDGGATSIRILLVNP